MAALAPLFRAALEQALASGDHPADLVEREEIAKLLDESTLAAAGMMEANAASNLGRLVGADLILTPFVHPVSSDELYSTVFAVDVNSARVLAARSWVGKPLEGPPADSLNALLSEAYAALSAGPAPPEQTPARRHAEADFLTGLSKSFLGLRQGRATEAEIALSLADAALALAHDDPKRMRETVVKLMLGAIPGPRYPLEIELHPNSKRIGVLKELIDSGRLAMVHEQARRIFGVPIRELLVAGTDEDKRLHSSYHLDLGEPEEAYALLTAGGTTHQQLAVNDRLYERAAESLLAMGRYQECVDLIEHRGRFSNYTTTLLLDALHASGQHEREFQIIWINRKNTLRRVGVDMMARFLKLAATHGDPADSLVAFSRFANPWEKNHAELRVPIVRLRIAAGQKDQAISDAQCAWLSSRLDGRQDLMKELGEILASLGAKPFDHLPAPSEFVRFPDGTRIDLFHDQTIEPDFASSVAADLARCWGCAVHVIDLELDPTRVSSHNALNQSMEGRDLARGFVSLPRRPGPLLQTIILTNHKLVSTERNFVGDIYSASSLRGSVEVVSTYYFHMYKEYDSRPLERITAIAAAPFASVHRKMKTDVGESDPDGERFQPLPPDFMASNGVLHVADRQLGVSPTTGALLRKHPAAAWLQAADEFRALELELEDNDPLADAAYFADLAAGLQDAKPVIIRPPQSN